MASIKLSRKEFEKHVKLTDEVKNKISMLGTHFESVTNEEIEIEVLPNRPDLLSLQGFLRALLPFIGKDNVKKYKVENSGLKLIVDKSIPAQWPYAYACIIKGLKFDDEKIKEIIQIQEKLGATLLRNRKKGGIGLYPLDKISFPITVKGMNPNEIKFKPLEYPEQITGRQILSKHPTGRTYAHLIEKWDKFPVFVDKKGSIMSMPPIINSHDLGKIDGTTRDVFLEATGTDERSLKAAINIIATALADMGGKIYSLECIQQNGQKESIPNLLPKKTKLSIDNANRILGLNIKEKDLEKILPKMGYEYSKGQVSIPAWRTDVLHEVDIIEDIAIGYGYDNITPEMPKVSTIGAESKESKINRKISEILVGLKLLETSSLHLIKDEEAKISKIKDLDKIEVENSKTEYKILRPSLAIPHLRILSENKDNEYPQKIFEIGKVFKKDMKNISETGIAEESNLIVSCSPSNFTELKQILDYLCKMLNINYELKESLKSGFIEGRTGAIVIQGKEIGHIGEMHPETLIDWGIKMPVACFEIKLDEIYSLF